MASENVFRAAVLERAEFELHKALRKLRDNEQAWSDFEKMAMGADAAKELIETDPETAAEYLTYGARVSAWAWWIHQRGSSG